MSIDQQEAVTCRTKTRLNLERDLIAAASRRLSIDPASKLHTELGNAEWRVTQRRR